MVKKFKSFIDDRHNIIKMEEKLKEIEYILKDEGLNHHVTEHLNREFKFPRIGVKRTIMRYKLDVNSELTKDEIINSDFFQEWLDRASEICEPNDVSLYPLNNVGNNNILIYFYYN